MTRNRRMTSIIGITSCALLLTLAAGCGTGGQKLNPAANGVAGNSTGQASRATPGDVTGTASVAYAGSLQLVNEQMVGPGFTESTGLSYQGRGGGSFAIAQLIKSGEITPNVMMSVGAAPIAVLKPKFTTWAVGFASSPLVIAYSPQSPFASQLQAIAKGQAPLSQLFQLMAHPNFHLGRTNPNTDPQGQAFIFMTRLAEQELHLPSGTAQKVLGGVNNPKQIFDEEAILSRLQAGQLDAASAYLPEAVERHLPYIRLPDSINLGDPADAALYATQHLKLADGQVATGEPIEVYITAIQSAKDAAAGDAFVKYVLSPAARKMYQQQGYTLTKAMVYGDRSAIPASIASELGQVK